MSIVRAQSVAMNEFQVVVVPGGGGEPPNRRSIEIFDEGCDLTYKGRRWCLGLCCATLVVTCAGGILWAVCDEGNVHCKENATLAGKVIFWVFAGSLVVTFGCITQSFFRSLNIR